MAENCVAEREFTTVYCLSECTKLIILNYSFLSCWKHWAGVIIDLFYV